MMCCRCTLISLHIKCPHISWLLNNGPCLLQWSIDCQYVHSDDELNLVFSSVSRADRSLQRCVSTSLISALIYEGHQLLPAGIQIRTKSIKYLSIYSCSTHLCCGKIFMSMLTLQVFNCKCTIVIKKHITVKHIKHN